MVYLMHVVRARIIRLHISTSAVKSADCVILLWSCFDVSLTLYLHRGTRLWCIYQWMRLGTLGVHLPMVYQHSLLAFLLLFQISVIFIIVPIIAQKHLADDVTLWMCLISTFGQLFILQLSVNYFSRWKLIGCLLPS